MKKQNFNELSAFDEKLTELNESDLMNVNGGFAHLLIALEIYGGICALAYGAGALTGILSKN